jgi:L-ascorbate metabolism protein UlaG (beta-lactamase superfamily)
VLIDPLFEGNPTAPCPWQSITNCDAVLLTHDHGDHIGQAAEICQATGAMLVCLFDVVPKMKDRGVAAEKILGMNLGGSVEIAGLRIKMVQAVHSGDTALFSDMKLFRRFFDIDLALLPIGGWFTMDAQEAAVACSFLGCRKVVPMHWGTFPVLAQNTEAFAAALKEQAPGTELISMRLGEPEEIA